MNLVGLLFETKQMENQLLNLIAKLLWVRKRLSKTEPNTERNSKLHNLEKQTENEYILLLKNSSLEELYQHKEFLSSFESFNKNTESYVTKEIVSRVSEDHEEATEFLKNY